MKTAPLLNKTKNRLDSWGVVTVMRLSRVEFDKNEMEMFVCVNLFE